MAADAGISSKTLRRASESLKIVKEKTGMKGGWVWSLPGAPEIVSKGEGRITIPSNREQRTASAFPQTRRPQTNFDPQKNG